MATGIAVPVNLEDVDHPAAEGGNATPKQIAKKNTGLWSRGYKALEAGCTKAWGKLSTKDRRQRFVHPLKVGVALALAALLMLLKAPDEWLGDNAIWAVMTVVVVFQTSVGATISKGLNRGVATALAGCLALGVEEIANASGHPWDAVLIGTSVMIVGVICTSIRFMPNVKVKYDYGLQTIMLTYSLIVVSGYQTSREADVTMAWERLFVILVASALCLIVSVSVFPAWSGTDLHNMVASHFDDLAFALEECSSDYVKGSQCKSDEAQKSKLEGQKKEAVLAKFNSILGSGSKVESLANLASWEPFHGKFGFRHPWTEYVKLDGKLRHCARAVLTMDGCLNSGMQSTPHAIPPSIKLEMTYATLETYKLLKELGGSVRNFQKCGEKKVITKAMRHATSCFQTSVAEHLQLVFTTRVIVPKILNPVLWRLLSTDKTKRLAFDKSPLLRASSYSSINGRGMPSSPPCGSDNFKLPSVRSPRPKNSKVPKFTFVSKKPITDKVAILQPNTTTIKGVKSVSLATFAALLDEIVTRLDDMVDALQELGAKAKFKEASYDVSYVDIV